MKMFSFVLAAFLSAAMPLQAQDFAWAGQIVGTTVSRLATDAAGNVYALGGFEGTVDFDLGPGVVSLTSGEGSSALYVAKYDSDGGLIWARQFGGTSLLEGSGIAVDSSGNMYTTGRFRATADFDPDENTVFSLTTAGQDAFVVKLDTNGNFVWAVQLSAANGRDIAVDGAGNVYTAGDFSATADFDPDENAVSNVTSAGSSDAFVWKLDTDGNFVWAVPLGGAESDSGRDIALSADGSAVHILGRFSGEANFDPDGSQTLTSEGEDAVFVSKLDSEGGFVWAGRVGGPESAAPQDLAIDAGGNVYATGFFSGIADFDPGPGAFNLTYAGKEAAPFILKLDPMGAFAWAGQFAPASDFFSEAEAVAVEGGAVYVVGKFQGVVDFDPGPDEFNLESAAFGDTFVSKLTSDGTFVSAQQFFGFQSTPTAAALDGRGGIYVSGRFSGSVDFDPGPGVFGLIAVGNSNQVGAIDGFLVKLQGEPVAEPPVISEGGIVLATLLPTVHTVSPFSIISVFGQNFSAETILFPNLNEQGRVDTILGGTCLMMNGQALPIFAMTPGQINAQASADKTLGPASFTVVADCATASPLPSQAVTLSGGSPAPQALASEVESATVEEATPGFFLYPPLAEDGFIAARFNSDNAAVAPVGMFTDEFGPSRPAAPGDIIVLYGTGWGQTTAVLATGELATEAAELMDEANPMVSFGGIFLAPEDVLYVGITPQAAGLYQLAIRVPASAQPGNNQIVLTVYAKSTPLGPVIPVAAP